MHACMHACVCVCVPVQSKEAQAENKLLYRHLIFFEGEGSQLFQTVDSQKRF